jgi:hypothetical protein
MVVTSCFGVVMQENLQSGESEEMKDKKLPVLGAFIVLIGLLVVDFGGRMVSVIGTKDYFYADLWSSVVLLFGACISSFGVWVAGVRIRRLGGKLFITIHKKAIRISN